MHIILMMYSNAHYILYSNIILKLHITVGIVYYIYMIYNIIIIMFVFYISYILYNGI